MEEYKRKQYEHLFTATNGALFQPCGFGTFGQPGPGAKSLLQQLKAFFNTHHPVQTSTECSNANELVSLKTRLSLAIAKTVGRNLCAALDLSSIDGPTRNHSNYDIRNNVMDVAVEIDEDLGLRDLQNDQQ